ncbi:MAG: hypothetical protein ACI8S6_005028 [Myxococcota bacterium]|jgi:hypothetical protein
MFKRILTVSLLAAFPMTANAGFGVTAALGSYENSINTDYYVPQHAYPTIDYKQGPYLVQVAVLDLINTMASDDEDQILFGLNGFYRIGKGPIAGEVHGVRQIGATIDYNQVGQDITFTTVQAAFRMGAEASKKMGIGLYVVPEIGVNIASEDAREESLEIAVGGQVQLSIWMAGK